MLMRTFVLGLMLIETIGAANLRLAAEPPIPACWPCEVRAQATTQVAEPPIPACWPCEAK